MTVSIGKEGKLVHSPRLLRQVLRHELAVGRRHRHARAGRSRRRLALGPERADVAAHGDEVGILQVAQVEPRHRRAHWLTHARQPLRLGHVLHVQAQVHRVGRAPRAVEADRAADE